MATLTIPPKEGLVRARPDAVEVRAADTKNGMPTLVGHLAVFDESTEINSLYEGRFVENLAPGSFSKTIKEQRNDIKVLYNHGHDTIGDKPLGVIRLLEEDDVGVRYEVELLDTPYVRELVPAIEAGLLGASFKFRVIKEEFDEEPEASDANPDALPVRTVTELRLYEFGPVTFPAYPGASAGTRSMTDFDLLERMVTDPERFQRVLDHVKGAVQAADHTTSTGRADESHSDAQDEETSTDGAEATHSSGQDGASGSDDNTEDGAERTHSEDGSQATTPITIDSEDGEARWFEDESEKEWVLP